MALELLPPNTVACSEYCYVTIQEIIRTEYMWPKMALFISNFVKVIHEVQNFKWGQGAAKETSKHNPTQQHGDILVPRF